MKRTLVDYVVLHAESGEELAREVRRYSKLDWEPQGGVAMRESTQDGDTVGTWYAQAMVLYLADGRVK